MSKPFSVVRHKDTETCPCCDFIQTDNTLFEWTIIPWTRDTFADALTKNKLQARIDETDEWKDYWPTPEDMERYADLVEDGAASLHLTEYHMVEVANAIRNYADSGELATKAIWNALIDQTERAGATFRALDIRNLSPTQAQAMAQNVVTYRRTTPKRGRNDPCPCGSGRKLKKCCG